MSILNPVTTKTDFGGPVGSIFVTVVLPITVFFLYFICNPNYVVEGCNIRFDIIKEMVYNELIVNWKFNFFNSKIWSVYLCWFFGLTFLDLIVPGEYKKGVVLRDGTQLTYLINGVGLSSVLCSILLARWFITGGQLPELVFLYDNFLPIMITTMEFSILLSNFVYLCSFVPLRKPNGLGTNERILAVGGNHSFQFFNWFIGRELNPRIGSWDIKLFCELRPGMLLWFLYLVACLHHQYLETGVTNSLLLVVAMQALYIFDGVLNEEGCLTMMDITTDGFGFMLAFGDLTWVPFTYILQARYLSIRPVNLSGLMCIIVVLCNVAGFYIFKSSNDQKSNFRQGKLPHLKSIETKTGSKLLVEGWWGLSQHINYFGDLLVTLSWCLATGFNTPLTYYQFIYFAILLLHRQTRDEEKCRNKYGEAWVEYETLVPWKFIPWVY